MGDTTDIHSTADYIYDLTAELAKLASDARLEMLAYLLDLAQLEASRVRDRHAGGRDGVRSRPRPADGGYLTATPG